MRPFAGIQFIKILHCICAVQAEIKKVPQPLGPVQKAHLKSKRSVRLPDDQFRISPVQVHQSGFQIQNIRFSLCHNQGVGIGIKIPVE